MRKLIFLFLFVIPFAGIAQYTDNFSDGNYTANPAWVGDLSEFTVNATQQLQSNGVLPGPSSLAVPTSLATLNNTEWQCYVKLNFSPSTSNYSKIYLTSDQQNLEGNLNGYFLQIGETGSNDAIELFKQTGTTPVSVARGTNGFVANAFTIRIKVTRDNAGLWSIYADAAAGTNFVLQATGTDATFNTSSYAGVVCGYTSSNLTNFFFDDFSIGPVVADVTPPTIVSATAISSTQVDVKFSEAVSQTIAETEINYSANNGLGNPSSALRDVSDLTKVHLTYATAFVDGTLNTLTVNNIADLSSNVITANSTTTFTYNAPVSATAYDVVINEIYFEPSTSSPLPNAEFVELYNRSSNAISLSGWQITDGSTSIATIGNVTLLPDSFIVVCNNSNVALLAPFGTATGTTSFPSLNNDTGDDLRLNDNNGNQIDRVVFSDANYNDDDKNDGGFTIERIDPDFLCDNIYNWKASADPKGGTPGKINSVNGTYTDTTSPEAFHAYPASPTSIQITFSETPDAGFASLISSYAIDNGIGQPISVSISDLIVTLTLADSIQPGIIYTITISDSIRDCPGNLLAGSKTLRVALPEVVAAKDILINEILFNPKPNGDDFVELYNNSQKVIDLKTIRIANADDADLLDTQYPITTTGYLMFPGDYVALTENRISLKEIYPSAVDKAIFEIAALPSYNDDAGRCVITDFSFNRIDQFNYTEDLQYPLLDDAEGVSLERLSLNRSTQDITNWHSAAQSAGFATPGYKNSQYVDNAEASSELTISPELFSPDNDGYNDVINFSMNMNANGYVLNADVYNEDGRLIKKLAKSKLLAPQDAFSWDGITDDNDKAPVGIYILYAKAFNPTGDVKKFKKAFVLATKL